MNIPMVNVLIACFHSISLDRAEWMMISTKRRAIKESIKKLIPSICIYRVAANK